MRKIEEGCTAIILGGVMKENTGIVVTVGKFIGKFENAKEYSEASNLWEINKAVKFLDGKFYKMCSEGYLQRIDDDTNTVDDVEEIKEMEETI